MATRTAMQSVAHTWGMAIQETHPRSSVSLSYVNAGTPAKAAIFMRPGTTASPLLFLATPNSDESSR